uniref:Uncharacterized protein n=1 Tax=Panagrolaimus sp. JU765 TaxID=591449 RepID=A0AC34R4L7_9BILA
MEEPSVKHNADADSLSISTTSTNSEQTSGLFRRPMNLGFIEDEDVNSNDNENPEIQQLDEQTDDEHDANNENAENETTTLIKPEQPRMSFDDLWPFLPE